MQLPAQPQRENFFFFFFLSSGALPSSSASGRERVVGEENGNIGVHGTCAAGVGGWWDNVLRGWRMVGVRMGMTTAEGGGRLLLCVMLLCESCSDVG